MKSAAWKLVLAGVWLGLGCGLGWGQETPLPAVTFAGQGDTGWLPPDTHGAVGPNHVVTAVNGGVRVQDRNGTVLKSTALNTFLNRTDTVFDPKVYYDHFADRWLMAACANAASANSAVLVAASQGADPTGGWWVYSFDADASNNLWADYPSVGFNKDWFAVSMNMFQVGGSGGFSTGRLWVMPRVGLLGGGTVNATLFNDANGFTMVPAVTHDAALATLYVVQTFNGNSGGRGYLRLLGVTGAVNAPQFAEIGQPSTTRTWRNNTVSGGNILPQSGGPLINGGDDRMQHVVYRNGALWATHNGYAVAGSSLRSFVQWWQLGTQAQVLQYGRIEDTGGTFHYCFPSLAVNRGNDMLLGCSRFSAGTFPSAVYAFRGSGDAAETIRAPRVYAAGATVYQKNDNSGRNRWGDYSATVTDPVDDASFWTVQEHSSATANRWATSWARVAAAATTSTIRFVQSAYSAGEAAGTAAIAVTRSGNLRSVVTVQYATANGSAAAGGDYTASSGTLTFNDGEETKSFSVSITNDAAVEGDETVNLTLSNPGAGAVLGAPAAAVLTIADNDSAAPVVSVAASDSSASEPADPAVFTFTRSGSTALALAVSYTMGGTATNGTDYQPLAGPVTIPAGSTTATVTLTPVDDTATEGAETAVLTLTAAAGYTVGTPSSATVNLLDNDQPAVVTVAASDPAAGEPADTGQFTVTRSGGTTAAMTVNLTSSGTAAAGADYAALPASVTIPAGAAGAAVAVNPLDDGTVEGTETVVLTIAAGAGYTVGSPASATVSLADNDAAAGNDMFAGRYPFSGLNLTGQNTTATKESGEPNHAGNTGGRSVWWTWTAGFSGSVTFSTEGSNFDTLLAVYTGGAVNGLSQVAADDDSGPNRTSRVTFSAVAGTVYQIAVDGYNGAAGTIALGRTPDPAQLATVTVAAGDPSATEGAADPGTFTIARSGATAASLAVTLAIGGSATNAADYQQLATTFTLPAGAASGTLTVTPLDDSQVEGAETVTVTLQAGGAYQVGSPGSATVTIQDNDSTVGNDFFGNAAVMTAATAAGTNVGATKEAGEPDHAGNAGGRSVWWRWTATFSGSVTFHTEGSGFDTLLAVYTGSAVNGLGLVAADDDSGPNGTSRLTFSAVLGTVYQIAVDGFGGASGAVALARLGDPAPTPLVVVAADDATAKEGSGDNGRFVISRTGSTAASLAVNVSFGGTAGNGADYATLATNQVIPAGAAALALTVSPVNDALPEGDETVTMTIEPGAGYEVEGDAIPYVPGGRATAMVTIIDNDVAATNDAFADRFALAGSGFSVTGGNATFTKELGEPSHAGNAGGKSAWWRWTAPATSAITISTGGSDFDTLLAVYTGNSVSALALVAADDDSGAGLTSEVSFTAIAGTVYQIVVDGYRGGTGSAAGGAVVLTGTAGAAVQPPELTGPTAAAGTVGLPFSYTITASNSPTGFGASGLPGGLLFNAATGEIAGTPDTAGQFWVAISATNGGGTANGTLDITVLEPAGRVLYQTDFSSFAAGAGTVVGDDGWLGDLDGHGTYNALPARGLAMYVGFDTSFSGDIAWFWRPLDYDPLSAGTPLVRLTAEIAVIDSTNGRRDDFAIQFYNRDGDYLASILFDNSSGKIYLDDDLSESYIDTGKTFDKGVFASLEVEIDYAGNTWRALRHGSEVFGWRPFHLGGKALTLGDVTLAWILQSPGSPGDNLLVVDNFSVAATADGSATFASSSALTVPASGAATPYPSTIQVGGLAGQIDRLSVRLDGLAHSWPDDLDVLLVAPDGRGVVLMSDSGGSTAAYVNHTLTFDDLAPTGLLTDDLATHAARYRPTDFSEGSADAFPAPAPAGPYLTALSAMYGGNPNGAWKLFVFDDGALDSGSLATWSIEIGTTAAATENYAGWRARYFSAAEINAGLGAENGDPDGDRLDNLLEYALGLNPRLPDRNSPRLPFATVESPGGVRSLCFNYTRDLSRSGIIYQVETSTDLVNWSPFTGQDAVVGQAGSVQSRKAWLPIVNPRAVMRLVVRAQ